MANLKLIRKRIRSVNSTKQITRVMEMVSASKLARVQGTLVESRPYAHGLENLLRQIVGSFSTDSDSVSAPNPFMEPRSEIKHRCMVVFTSDRGLCGAFNNNIINLAEKSMTEGPEAYTLVCFGNKGVNYFRKRGWNIGYELTDNQGRIQQEEVRKLSDYLTSGFKNHTFDEIRFAFTAFRSVSKYEPTLSRFLPLEPPKEPNKTDEMDQVSSDLEYIFEPNAATVLGQLLPDYLSSKLHLTLLESLASEHAARMTAMRNATDNARDMIKSLTLEMNKARQAAITTEISEIVSGAEAIKG